MKAWSVFHVGIWGIVSRAHVVRMVHHQVLLYGEYAITTRDGR